MLTQRFLDYLKKLDDLRNLNSNRKYFSPENLQLNFLNNKTIPSVKDLEDSLPDGFQMDFLNEQIILRDLKEVEQDCLVVNFLKKSYQQRLKENNSSQEILPSLFSLKRGNKTVCDLTAGFGSDLVIIASSGFEVEACESHPAVYLLLLDGLSRLFATNTNLKINLHYKKGEDFLERRNQSAKKYDVIYIDPLFVEKSSKSKKEMEVLKKICRDQDPEQLFKKALIFAKDRLVVKRQIKAPYLVNKKPIFEKKGKSFRFDVYQMIR